IRGFPGEPRTPGPTVNEDVDRSVRALRRVDVERLDGRRAVRVAPGRGQTGAYVLAVGRVALDDLGQIRRVLDLIVRGVELGLVHVEPHGRSLDPRRRLSGR